MTWLLTSSRKLLEAKKAGASYDPQGRGINTTHWFWGAADRIRASNGGDAAPAGDDVAIKDKSADEELNEILLQNPEISAPSLVNEMKAKGLRVVKNIEAFNRLVNAMREKNHSVKREGVFSRWAKSLKPAKPKEADSASAFPAVLVKPQEAKFNFKTMNLREATSDDGIGPTRFKVVLLQEGLGNFGDAFYYSRGALESAIPIFTGTKIFADHPSAVEEETRPERSVRDVLGHFDNIKVESDKDERAMLTGEVQILPDKPFEWARALMRHAIDHAKKFPDQPFVGLSINASGDADESSIDEVMKSAPSGARPKLAEAKERGISSVRVVSKIKDAISCDLVTAAGAGGGFVSVIK
jgi:hypothetical protein